jgi:hypothetical protein
MPEPARTARGLTRLWPLRRNKPYSPRSDALVKAARRWSQRPLGRVPARDQGRQLQGLPRGWRPRRRAKMLSWQFSARDRDGRILYKRGAGNNSGVRLKLKQLVDTLARSIVLQRGLDRPSSLDALRIKASGHLPRLDVKEGLAQKVTYRPDRISKDEIRDKTQHELLQMLLYTKFESWNYEAEWRVLCAGQRMNQEGSSPSGARMRGAVSKGGGNSSLAGRARRYGEV